MIKPPSELIDAFLRWYENDPHSKHEDIYAGRISKEALEVLSGEAFIEFFLQFARDGGKVQGVGYRSAPLMKRTMEANYEDFRNFMLEPFSGEFDALDWLQRLDSFKGLGRGLATIYLNRIDKKSFAILNNKSIGAVRLLGGNVPGSGGGMLTAREG